jgi:hypothetical protein
MRLGVNDSPGNTDDRVREIPKWAGRFARNQTVPLLVFQVIFVLGSAMFAGLACLLTWAHTHGQRALAVASLVALCAFGVWWLWFSFFGGSGIIRRVSERLTRRRGAASVGPPAFAAGQRKPLAVFVFLFCVVLHMGLSSLGLAPTRYMQPISAIYVVPFMLYLAAKQWNTSSPFMLLYPGLYAAHAVLLAAGVPISRGPMFDMFFPCIGYAFLAAFAGYLYSRFALRRLRAVAASPDGGENAERATSHD